MKKNIIFLLFFILFSNLISDTNFRVMTYNSLMFSVYSGQSRFSDFETVFNEVNPDIVIMQEIEDEPGSDLMLNILNSDEIEFARAEFVDDGDLNNMLYYKTSKATLISQDVVHTYPRDISEYVLEIDGNQIRIYCCHLKASQGYEQNRFAAVSLLRNHLNQFEPGTEFIIAGDMNFYTSSEPAYQKFIADETNNTGRAKDWSDLVGNWHNNQDFSEAHSQSSRTNQFGGGVGGGLDDRFDFIFTYYEMNNNAEIEFIDGSLVTVGNDGNHFNQSINYGTNSAVSPEVANALYYASDHLPVFADFISLSSTNTDSQTISASNLILQNFPNPFNPTTTIYFNLTTEHTSLRNASAWQAESTELIIYNIKGKKIKTLECGESLSTIADGVSYSITWDGRNDNNNPVSSGIYFIKLKIGKSTYSKKITLLK